MAAMITRTITTWQVKAIVADFKSMTFETVATAVVESASQDAQLARRAFKERGFGVPRGAKLEWEPLGTATYACTVDAFMAIAKKVEKPVEVEQA